MAQSVELQRSINSFRGHYSRNASRITELVSQDSSTELGSNLQAELRNLENRYAEIVKICVKLQVEITDDQLEDGKLEIELDYMIELEETHLKMVQLGKSKLAECNHEDQVAQPPGPGTPANERIHNIHAPQLEKLEHDTSLRDFGT